MFIVYFIGTAATLFVIMESTEGRRSAARHHVTHAKLLRDVTLWKQVTFVLAMIKHGGERYGNQRECR